MIEITFTVEEKHGNISFRLQTPPLPAGASTLKEQLVAKCYIEHIKSIMESLEKQFAAKNN